jgi:hypothetical protein
MSASSWASRSRRLCGHYPNASRSPERKTHRSGFVLNLDYGVDTTCRNGLRAANTATAPIKAKLVVAMPRRRERILPLMPKLARRNTTPARNNIESSAICESAAKFDTLNSLGSWAACTAPNVMPSVTGKKATEAATAKNAAHAPARCSRVATSKVPQKV